MPSKPVWAAHNGGPQKAIIFFRSELTLPGGEGRSPDRNLASNGQRLAFTPAVLVFIALPETENKLDPGGGGLNGPAGLTFGPDDNLYVTSLGSSSMLKDNGSTGAFLSVFVQAR